jgi:TnsA endonuclease N terminal
LDLNSCDSVESPIPSSVRVIPRSRRSVTGYQTFRRQHSIQYESTLERDFIVRQEFDLAVAQVISQPCRIPFTTPSGRQSHYTPDFLVVFKTNSAPPSLQTKPLLIEVKPEADWRRHWREWLGKWKAARRYAESQGWRFRIMDDRIAFFDWKRSVAVAAQKLDVGERLRADARLVHDPEPPAL